MFSLYCCSLLLFFSCSIFLCYRLECEKLELMESTGLTNEQCMGEREGHTDTDTDTTHNTHHGHDKRTSVRDAGVVRCALCVARLD